MLKNKLFYSFAILALCVAALASCTGGNRTDGKETSTTDGLVSDVEEGVSDVEGKIREGVSDVESDINDGGLGDREDATHGTDGVRDGRHGHREETDDFFRHRGAVPFGK